MASVPDESLGKKAMNLTKKVCKKTFIYSVFFIILVEVFSLFIRDKNNYVNYYYPILTQLSLFIMLFNIFYSSSKLRFCNRKKLAIFSLMMYYLVGFFSIFIELKKGVYLDVVSNLLLFTSVVLIFLSLIRKR